MATSTNSEKGQSIARTLTNQSKRKAREKVESKPAFKNVLYNPFEIKWPVIAPNVQNAILARVTELLSGVAQFNIERQIISRTKQKNRKRPIKNTKPRDSVEEPPAEQGDSLPSTVSDAPSTSSPPAILRSITIGINEVTKRLESHCQIPRSKLPTSLDESMEPASGASSRIGVVIVCKPDIDPPLLVAHIPHLVAACNNVSRTSGKMAKLVTLPKGSELALSQALGLRRAAVLELDETVIEDSALATLLESVPLVVAPWLATAPLRTQVVYSADGPPPKQLRTGETSLVPTHIKQLRTTAPKDMRAAKESRAKGRAEAKAKRKAPREKGV